MFLRSICTGPASRLTTMHVLGRHDLAARRARGARRRRRRSARGRPARSRTTIGYSLPRSRNCAAVVPATLVWIVVATPGRSCRASPPSGDRRAWRSRAGLPRGRAARRRCRRSSSIIARASCAMRRASSRSWPRISSERPAAVLVAVVAAAEQPVELEVAAGGIGADDDAGQPGELAAQRLRDLVVGARALVARHEHDADLAAVVLAAAAAAAASCCRRRRRRW